MKPSSPIGKGHSRFNKGDAFGVEGLCGFLCTTDVLAVGGVEGH